MDSSSVASEVSGASQPPSNLIAPVLADASSRSGHTAISLKEATSRGSAFVTALSKAPTRTSTLFGELIGSSGSSTGILHDGVVYPGSSWDDYRRGLISVQAVNRPISVEEFQSAMSLAHKLKDRADEAWQQFRAQEPASQRWAVFRQSYKEVLAIAEKHHDKVIKKDMRDVFIVDFKKCVDEEVAIYISRNMKNIQGASEIWSEEMLKPTSVSLEIARAACGEIGNNGPLEIFDMVAGELEDCCQLDVNNTDLFAILKLEDHVD